MSINDKHKQEIVLTQHVDFGIHQICNSRFGEIQAIQQRLPRRAVQRTCIMFRTHLLVAVLMAVVVAVDATRRRFYVKTSGSHCAGQHFTKNQCQNELPEGGDQYQGETVCFGGSCAPQGCYLYSGILNSDGFYWNDDKSGDCESGKKCYCTNTVSFKNIRSFWQSRSSVCD